MKIIIPLSFWFYQRLRLKRWWHALCFKAEKRTPYISGSGRPVCVDFSSLLCRFCACSEVSIQKRWRVQAFGLFFLNKNARYAKQPTWPVNLQKHGICSFNACSVLFVWLINSGYYLRVCNGLLQDLTLAFKTIWNINIIHRYTKSLSATSVVHGVIVLSFFFVFDIFFLDSEVQREHENHLPHTDHPVMNGVPPADLLDVR